MHTQTRVKQVQMQLHTIDFGVGLDKHLAGFFPKQYRLPEAQEVVSTTVADGGVVVIESPASFHICCRLKHLQHHRIRSAGSQLGGQMSTATD